MSQWPVLLTWTPKRLSNIKMNQLCSLNSRKGPFCNAMFQGRRAPLALRPRPPIESALSGPPKNNHESKNISNFRRRLLLWSLLPPRGVPRRIKAARGFYLLADSSLTPMPSSSPQIWRQLHCTAAIPGNWPPPPPPTPSTATKPTATPPSPVGLVSSGGAPTDERKMWLFQAEGEKRTGKQCRH